MDEVLSRNDLRDDEKAKRYFQLQNRYLAFKEQLNTRTRPEEIISTVPDLTSRTQDSSTATTAFSTPLNPFHVTPEVTQAVEAKSTAYTFGSFQQRIQGNLFHHFIVVIHPCVIIIHHQARMLVFTWVLNSTTVAAIQLLLLNEFVDHIRISQFEYMTDKTGYTLSLDFFPLRQSSTEV